MLAGIPERKSVMKIVTALFVAATFSLALPSVAEAKGCLKGAAVGGVAGHYAGHHGVLGAAAGCLYGRHHAKEQDKEQERQQQGQLPKDNGQTGM
jgi:outer membrane lipoprotein SlyB